MALLRCRRASSALRGDGHGASSQLGWEQPRIRRSPSSNDEPLASRLQRRRGVSPAAPSCWGVSVNRVKTPGARTASPDAPLAPAVRAHRAPRCPVFSRLALHHALHPWVVISLTTGASLPSGKEAKRARPYSEHPHSLGFAHTGTPRRVIHLSWEPFPTHPRCPSGRFPL